MRWFKRSRREAPPAEAPYAVLQGERDGRPLFAIVNRGVPDASARGDAPWRLVVSAPLDDPTDTGLTSRSEAETLNELEEQVESVLTVTGVCHFLGRSTWNGLREIVYYVADFEAARAALGTLDAPAHRFDVRGESDPAWDLAAEWLAA